jgi:hypothetical protein
VFLEFQFFCLPNPVIVLDAAFEFLQFGVDTGDLGRSERGDLPEVKNAEVMQRSLEYLSDTDNLR